jgi:hypothetical protein
MHLLRSRSFLIFLLIGIGIRIWNLDSPLIDAMTARQTQTADAVRSMIEEPGFQLDANTSWRGTTDARILQELPIYNLFVQGVYESFVLILHTDPTFAGRADPRWIDISGRLVTILFWALTFYFAQFLWARFLSTRQAFWANALLVFAPLGVFYGQALMPEMIFIAISTGFVLATLRYADRSSVGNFLLVLLLGGLGCLVKFPAFSHMALLALVILWVENGWRFLFFRPLHWGGLVLIFLAMKLWSGQVTAVNTAHFTEWTSEISLRMFFGDLMARLRPHLYVKVAGYITVFVLTPIGVLIAALGLWNLWNLRSKPIGWFLGTWLLALVVYVLVWGPQCAGGHAYYNLPMLIPAAVLFGLGITSFFSWLENLDIFNANKTAQSTTSILSNQWLIVCKGFILAALALPAAIMTAYFFTEDRIVWGASQWAKQNVPDGEPVAVKLNHSPNTIDYMHVPTVGYYSGRPTFMLTRYTPEQEYQSALEQCRFIVETMPQPPGPMRSFAIALKGADRPVDPLTKATEAGFTPGPELPGGIRIWKK